MTTAEQIEKGLSLPVMEMFHSLQGEGFHTGKAAFFIRVGGCDVGCNWCDVKESWQAALHPLWQVEDIVKAVLASDADAAVITGGEPYLYNLTVLTEQLKEKSITIYVETSGSEPMSGQSDWICLSPKNNHPPLPYFYEHAHELKVIIQKVSDFKWAEENAALVHKDALLYLQPEWSVREFITPLIIDYVKQNPRWVLSLQTHKYLNIP
ncbi:MAG: 7-carboxy-7-deazaguanine synthase [Bacteroidetes bacterium ADurb.Bin408]|nr:MAG: 7-carboxy-7-deazaguanine synthase [Bacteroidetes bacterium ADurb.Bin408]